MIIFQKFKLCLYKEPTISSNYSLVGLWSFSCKFVEVIWDNFTACFWNMFHCNIGFSFSKANCVKTFLTSGLQISSPVTGEGVSRRPSIATCGSPHVLIASIPEDTPRPSAAAPAWEEEEDDDDEEEEEEEESQPWLRRKRRREDELLNLIKEDMRLQREAEEERAENEWRGSSLSSRGWLTVKLFGLLSTVILFS